MQARFPSETAVLSLSKDGCPAMAALFDRLRVLLLPSAVEAPVPGRRRANPPRAQAQVPVTCLQDAA